VHRVTGAICALRDPVPRDAAATALLRRMRCDPAIGWWSAGRMVPGGRRDARRLDVSARIASRISGTFRRVPRNRRGVPDTGSGLARRPPWRTAVGAVAYNESRRGGRRCPAMMHRRVLPWFLLIGTTLAACAGAARTAASSTAPAPREAPAAAYQAPIAPAPAAAPTGHADVNTDSSLISNGSVTASSDDLLPTASAFRREVYRLGGRVFAEQLHFRAEAEAEDQAKGASAASYRIKLLPRLLPDLLDWLGKHSTITAQDVASIIAMESEGDASIVRADVRARIGEIDGQLADPALDPRQRTALEQERAKLAGAASADPDAMADNTRRVAVLDVRLEAPHPLDRYAGGSFLGHARGSLLGLGMLGQARSNRVGGGVGIGGRSPVSSLEVMGYAAPAMNERAGVTITLGVGSYSRAFGSGNRSSFNPYVGARLGYAYLQASYLEVAAELGVELVKQRGVQWTVSARPIGLVGSASQGAVEVGSSLALAF
jgi:hypothetical protein